MLTFSEIKTLVDSFLIEQFGDVQLFSNGFMDKLSNAISRMFLKFAEKLQIQAVVNNDIYQVEGENMDRLYSQHPQMKRKAQAKAGGFWNLINSTPGTFVQTFELKLKSTTGAEYTNIQPFTVSPTGEATIPIIALEFGKSGNAEIGTINEITTPLLGIVEGTNLQPVYGGQNLETDSEYRKRYLIVSGLPVGLTKGDITKKVLSVSGVEDVNIIENYEETNKNFNISSGTLVLTRKSTAIFVRGGSDLDVATAISKKINLSIKRYGNVIVPVWDNDRELFEDIEFYRAIPKKIYTKFEIEGDVDINLTTQILKEVMLGARIGGYITSGMVERQIHNRLDTSKLLNIEFYFSYTNNTNFSNSLKLKEDEYISEIEVVPYV